MASDIETALAWLRRAIANAEGAQATVLALLLSREPEVRGSQLALVGRRFGPAFAERVASILPADFAEELRVPFLAEAARSLQKLESSARDALLETARALARANGCWSPGVHLLVRLVRDALLPAPAPPPGSGPGSFARHASLLLSLMAHTGSRGADEAAAAFARGAAHLEAGTLALAPASELRAETLDQALDYLNALSLKEAGPVDRLLGALVATALHDGRLSPERHAMLRAIYGMHGSPLPPLPATHANDAVETDPGRTAATAVAMQPAAPAGGLDRLAPTAAAPKDVSVWGIVIANLFTLAIALWQNWGLLHLMWPYWMQSVIIGWYARKRALRLARSSTEGVEVNDRPTKPAREFREIAKFFALRFLHVTPASNARFFAFHYGFFHLFYLVFLAIFTFRADPQGFFDMTSNGKQLPVQVGNIEPADFLLFLALSLGFLLAHRRSHQEHVRADLARMPDPDLLFWVPYARILPMHIVLAAGMGLGGSWPVWLFVLLKTFADLLMHKVEHRWLQGKGSAAAPT